MNLENRPAAFAKRMIAPVLYFTLLILMSKQLTVLLFYKKTSNKLTELIFFKGPSNEFTEQFFFKSQGNELNALGEFISNIHYLVPWVLFAVGAGWFIATFFGKGLQMRSPLFIVGASYLIFFFQNKHYQSIPLYLLSVAFIVPFILQHLSLTWRMCYSVLNLISFFKTIFDGIESLASWLKSKCIMPLYNALASILLWITKPITCIRVLFRYQRIKKANKSLWQYDSIKEGDPNSLAAGRKEIVELICDEVKKMSDDRHSFTIGLEGGWGTGKSTLFEHIKKSLKGKDSNGLTVECIDFSPWAYPEGQNLSIEFLHELRRTLTKHSFRVRFVVNSYINALTSGYSLGPLRMLLGILFPKESLSRVKQKLNELILFHNLKLVVFIDDLDRLDEKEIAEVFKMLRNTGDMANTVYLVAYDRPNVERFDKFCKGFLDKIINVEIDLSPYDGAILFEKFIRDIRGEFKKPLFSEDNNFDNILSIEQHPHIIREISNYRDIKRLTNSVKTRIKLLEEINSKLINDESIGITKGLFIEKNFFIFLEIVKMKDYNLYLDIKNQHIYKDDFSEEIKKGFIKIKSINNRRSIQCKYENRYKEMLLEYIIKRTESTNDNKKTIYIPRFSLSDYFASNAKELHVATIIRSYLRERIEPNSGILDWLEGWKRKEELIDRVIVQTKLSLEVARKEEKSLNYCQFIACLVSIEEYYYPLEKTIKNFCNNYGNDNLFYTINEYRHNTEHVEINEKQFKEVKNIEINKETTYDRLYNHLVGLNYKNNDKPEWYNIIIQSQEERIEKLVDKGYIKRASKIKCWSKMEGNVHILSKRATDILFDNAQENPEKFLSEWVFVEVQNNNLLYLQDGIISLFSTANELKNFINKANKDKKSKVLEAMSILIYDYFISTPVQKQYPVGFLHCNNQILDAITGQDTTN